MVLQLVLSIGTISIFLRNDDLLVSFPRCSALRVTQSLNLDSEDVLALRCNFDTKIRDSRFAVGTQLLSKYTTQNLLRITFSFNDLMLKTKIIFIKIG